MNGERRERHWQTLGLMIVKPRLDQPEAQSQPDVPDHRSGLLTNVTEKRANELALRMGQGSCRHS